jgi:phosphomannomutase
MIPWILVAELMSTKRSKLSSLVKKRVAAYPCSGEINYKVRDSKKVIKEIEGKLSGQASLIERTDGLGMEFEHWRLNIRTSNTEPLLRLNVEAKGDCDLVQKAVVLVEDLIKGA